MRGAKCVDVAAGDFMTEFDKAFGNKLIHFIVCFLADMDSAQECLLVFTIADATMTLACTFAMKVENLQVPLGCALALVHVEQGKTI